MSLDSVQESAKTTLKQFLEKELRTGYTPEADGNIFLNSEQLGLFTRTTFASRVASLCHAIDDKNTLVEVFNGEARIAQFLDRFEDKTRAFVAACESPSAFREQFLSSRLAQALLAAGLTIGAAQVFSGHHHGLAWGMGALSFLQGLRMNCDFTLRFNAQRDGATPEKATLPKLFAQADGIARSEPSAPRWLAWGTSMRFSLETLNELWETSYGDWVNPSLAQAIDLDDRINLMPFWERLRVAREARRLLKENKDAFEALRLQSRGPKMLIDFILLKAGTAGLRHPRLLVGFRLPPYANEDDGDSGPGRDPPPDSTRPGPSFTRSPELIH